MPSSDLFENKERASPGDFRVPHPDITPKSAGFGSPVHTALWTSMPPERGSSAEKGHKNKRKTQTRKAKASYFDRDNENTIATDGTAQDGNLPVRASQQSSKRGRLIDSDSTQGVDQGDGESSESCQPKTKIQGPIPDTYEMEDPVMFDDQLSPTPRSSNPAHRLPPSGQPRRRLDSESSIMQGSNQTGPAPQRGQLVFSSVAPSVALSVDQDRSNSSEQKKMAAAMRGVSVMQDTIEKKPAARRETKARGKTKTQSLDLEEDQEEEFDNFELSKVPQSRGSSPVAPRRKTKAAGKKANSKANKPGNSKQPVTRQTRNSKATSGSKNSPSSDSQGGGEDGNGTGLDNDMTASDINTRQASSTRRSQSGLVAIKKESQVSSTETVIEVSSDSESDESKKPDVDDDESDEDYIDDCEQRRRRSNVQTRNKKSNCPVSVAQKLAQTKSQKENTVNEEKRALSASQTDSKYQETEVNKDSPMGSPKAAQTNRIHAIHGNSKPDNSHARKPIIVVFGSDGPKNNGISRKAAKVSERNTGKQDTGESPEESGVVELEPQTLVQENTQHRLKKKSLTQQPDIPEATFKPEPANQRPQGTRDTETGKDAFDSAVDIVSSSDKKTRKLEPRAPKFVQKSSPIPEHKYENDVVGPQKPDSCQKNQDGDLVAEHLPEEMECSGHIAFDFEMDADKAYRSVQYVTDTKPYFQNAAGMGGFSPEPEPQAFLRPKADVPNAHVTDAHVLPSTTSQIPKKRQSPVDDQAQQVILGNQGNTNPHTTLQAVHDFISAPEHHRSNCDQKCLDRPKKRQRFERAPYEPVESQAKFAKNHTSMKSPWERQAISHQNETIIKGHNSDDVFAPNQSSETMAAVDTFARRLGNVPSRDPAQDGVVNGPKHGRKLVSELHQPQQEFTEQHQTSIANKILAGLAYQTGRTKQEAGAEPPNDQKWPTAIRHGESCDSHVDRHEDENQGNGDCTRIQASEPYDEGIGQMMHQVVKLVLRGLKSKEGTVEEVVDDYHTEGCRIIQKMVQRHAKEREQLMRHHEQGKNDYIKVCRDARRRAEVLTAKLQTVNIVANTTHDQADAMKHRLQRLHQELS